MRSGPKPAHTNTKGVRHDRHALFTRASEIDETYICGDKLMSYSDFDMLAAVVCDCALPCALPMTDEFRTATPPSRSRPVATPILTRMPAYVRGKMDGNQESLLSKGSFNRSVSG